MSWSVLGALAAAEVSRRSQAAALAFGTAASSAHVSPCIVVKMGGSAITEKAKLETLNGPALDKTAQQIAAATKAGVQLAVLHGAGSFGHFQAKQYLISKGNSHPDWAFGFADTRRAVTKLNHEVVSRLVAAKVPAVGISPFPSAMTSGKKLSLAGSMTQAKAVLETGLVPVLHGDAVLDAQQGSAIVSGDMILDTLCASVQPTAAVFLTDVPGVFTKPPWEPGAKLIPEIFVAEDGSCELPEMSTAEHDVTGGIEEKLKTAIAVVVKCGIPVYIVQVGTQHAADALIGKVPATCTVLRRK